MSLCHTSTRTPGQAPFQVTKGHPPTGFTEPCKICRLCFVPINSILLNLLCVWSLQMLGFWWQITAWNLKAPYPTWSCHWHPDVWRFCLLASGDTSLLVRSSPKDAHSHVKHENKMSIWKHTARFSFLKTNPQANKSEQRTEPNNSQKTLLMKCFKVDQPYPFENETNKNETKKQKKFVYHKYLEHQISKLLRLWPSGVHIAWCTGVNIAWCTGVNVAWCAVCILQCADVLTAWCTGVNVAWPAGVKAAWCAHCTVCWCEHCMVCTLHSMLVWTLHSMLVLMLHGMLVWMLHVALEWILHGVLCAHCMVCWCEHCTGVGVSTAQCAGVGVSIAWCAHCTVCWCEHCMLCTL